MMIKKGVSVKKLKKRKQVSYGIPTDNHGAESMGCDVVEVAKLGFHLATIHFCSDSVPALKDDASIKCFSNVKQAHLTSSGSRGSSVRNVKKSMAEHCSAMPIIVGMNPENAILAVHNGEIIFGRRLVYQLGGFKLESQPYFYLNGNRSSLIDMAAPMIAKSSSHRVQTSKEDVPRKGSGGSKDGNFSLKHKQEAQGKSEVRDTSVVQWVMSLPSRFSRVIRENQIDLSPNRKTENSFEREIDKSILKEQKTERANFQATQTFKYESVDGSQRPKDKNSGLICESKEGVLSSSVPSSIKELPQPILGWPLLQTSASTTPKAVKESEARETSVVQCVMNLPNRSTSAILQTQIGFGSNNIETPLGRQTRYSGDNSNENCPPESGKPTKELELLLKTKSSGCRWFSYEELKNATSQFSSENLIGEGGCSSVYKGCLPSGKPVAVKILKPYKEEWNDFSLEIDIISSLKHKHITPLIGVCIDNDYLISVYDFLPRGSLEEYLHGNKGKSILPWDMRFKVAVKVAEALNYLHSECSPPVIHRDVKSSNILLSNEFQPQLSDFGLAIWGPANSNYTIHSDHVVGTFGYIAPEYFMHGRVSHKIDVYSYGVVLLELLSGKKPIGSKTLKRQESLVKWAKPLIDSGDLKALLDPKLDRDFDIVQVHKMVLAASLCINRSARLRPKASQILKLLRGKKDAKEWVKSYVNDLKETGDEEDDDTTSLSSAEQSKHFSSEDYLKERHC